MNKITMEDLDNMFNNMVISYSKMNTEVKEINDDYLYEMQDNIKSIKQYPNTDMKTLHIIAMKGYYDICKNYLIGNNPDILSNITNRTPLHYACMNSNNKIAELLLYNGANVNATDIYGNYPIDYANLANDYEMIELLECCGSIYYSDNDSYIDYYKLNTMIAKANEINDYNLITLVNNYIMTL